MRIAVIGGTGTLGSEVISQLRDHDVRCISRDEFKLYEVSQNGIDIRICDIRYQRGVEESLIDIEAVIHVAAMKDIFYCEEYQNEAYLTNVIGARNIANACKVHNIKNIVYMSTDKARNPTSYYGKTKYLAEREMLSCGAHVVHSGNIWASRRSLINTFDQAYEAIKAGSTIRLPITNPECTRFFTSCGKLAYHIIQKALKGARAEISSPQQYSTSLLEIMTKRYPKAKYDIIGLKPYEKLHEVMAGISSDDKRVFRKYEDLMVTL